MKRRVAILLSMVCVLSMIGIGLGYWSHSTEKMAHTMPKEEKQSIEELTGKPKWDAADMELLRRQTGLSREALLYLEENGRKEEITALQEAYFRPITITCTSNTIVTKEERVADAWGQPAKGMEIPYVENGDILITGCSHCLGWRNGHAAIVVDAEKRLILEAQVLGAPAVIVSMDYWERYPSFLVLRLEGADKEERAAIAAYAKEYLVGVPYRLTAGITDRLIQKKPVTTPAGTQCAH